MADKNVNIKINLETSGAEGSVKNFKTKLREATAELNSMTEKFGATSKEAASAAKEVARLKDTMGDAKALSDTFNPDKKFVALGGALQGAVAGFSALTGAMGLFGGESKEVEKLLLKVQSAMALQQGISGIAGAVDSFKLLGASIMKSSLLMKANNVLTVMATQIQRAFGVSVVGTGAAFTILKGAIIATGIGALVVVIGTLVSVMGQAGAATKTAAEEMQDLADATNNVNKAAQEVTDIYERQETVRIKRAKAAGASEEELTRIQREETQKRIDYRNKLINDGIETGIALSELYKGNLRDQQKLEDIALDHLIFVNNKRREELKNAERSENVSGRINPQIEMAQTVSTEIRKTAVDDAEFIKSIGEQNIEVQRNLALISVEIEEKRRAAIQALLESTGNALTALSGVVGEQTVAGKALAVAGALISTYQAIAKANALGFPANIPALIIAAATGFKAVKNIIAVKVPGKGSGGGSAPSIGSVSAPVIPQVGTTTLNQGQVNQIGNAAARAYVLETDVSGNQERIRRINRAARIN